ncbi:2-oxoacid:acceptor oxidoreductase family protein [candidate division WOR-3 bacterium]|nr:2-oxoacid:acceptor oxidoreductase family protein [candidate division WOR-3 bacterium]
MMQKVYRKPKGFYDDFFRNPSPDKKTTHYCPGCGHGIVHKYIAEAIEDFNIGEKTVWVSPVGCSVFGYYYFDCGHQQAAHGRAPAVATGIKRSKPESIVISYQGDGDLAAIGGNEILHAANRGESITVFFVNNSIYGMTGGQMAPTTLIGQKTTTSPYGRNAFNEGHPLKMSEILSQLESPVYVERVSLHDTAHRNKARQAIRKALQIQIENKGFSFVEILSMCPSGWKVSPVDALKWIKENQLPYFPVGVYKDVYSERKTKEITKRVWDKEKIVQALDLDRRIESYPRSKPKKEIFEEPKVKIAGFGGQGILMLGLLLAESAMLTGKEATWIPSYGPEMRGGTANCHVVIKNGKISNPSVDKPDILIAMNQPSLERFEKEVSDQGLIIIDTTLVKKGVSRKDVQVFAQPFADIADKELKNTKVTNTLILGALIGLTGMIDKKAIFDAFKKHITRENLIEVNKKAIDKGISLVK